MIKHIVMWRLKKEAHGKSSDANAVFIKEKLEALAGRIPGLLSIEVGIDVSGTDSSADVVLLSAFTDKAALEAYQSHAEHQALVPFIGGASSERRVVDYEC